MAQSSTVDQAVVAAIVTQVTNVLTYGGKMEQTITLEGFNATVSVQAQVSPDAPALEIVKESQATA